MTLKKFPAVYLLHGMGGSPNGSVLQLKEELVKLGQEQNYHRPRMPHADPAVAPSESVQYLASLDLPTGALVIGISMGGLVAASLQETNRPDLHVICINSPTWAGDVELRRMMKRRVSLYNHNDEVIAGRTEHWPLLVHEPQDLDWLTDHDTDQHKASLAQIIHCYMEARCLTWEMREFYDDED